MKVSTKIVSTLLPTTGCLHLVLVVTAVVLAKHSILTSFVISISPVMESDLYKRKRKRKRKKLPTCWRQKLSSLPPSGSSDHGSREVRSTEMKKRRCVFVLKYLNTTILAYFSYVREIKSHLKYIHTFKKTPQILF